MRYLLTKMDPRPTDKEIKDFLDYHKGEMNNDFIFKTEVIEKMRDEVENPKKGKGKKGKK
jgi:hypothetical protein